MYFKLCIEDSEVDTISILKLNLLLCISMIFKIKYYLNHSDMHACLHVYILNEGNCICIDLLLLKFK